jgi:hypothetical protein
MRQRPPFCFAFLTIWQDDPIAYAFEFLVIDRIEFVVPKDFPIGLGIQILVSIHKDREDVEIRIRVIAAIGMRSHDILEKDVILDESFLGEEFAGLDKFFSIVHLLHALCLSHLLYFPQLRHT